MTLFDSITEYVQAERRICPQPTHWNTLWGMLPHRQQIGAGWQPPPPLILAAWSDASDTQKRERLLLHLRYAEEHGAIESVAKFLRSLSPSDWYYKEGHDA
jgi:hypothetical protein